MSFRRSGESSGLVSATEGVPSDPMRARRRPPHLYPAAMECPSRREYVWISLYICPIYPPLEIRVRPSRTPRTLVDDKSATAAHHVPHIPRTPGVRRSGPPRAVSSIVPRGRRAQPQPAAEPCPHPRPAAQTAPSAPKRGHVRLRSLDAAQETVSARPRPRQDRGRDRDTHALLRIRAIEAEAARSQGPGLRRFAVPACPLPCAGIRPRRPTGFAADRAARFFTKQEASWTGEAVGQYPALRQARRPGSRSAPRTTCGTVCPFRGCLR
jgi:hypothetical protein